MKRREVRISKPLPGLTKIDFYENDYLVKSRTKMIAIPSELGTITWEWINQQSLEK